MSSETTANKINLIVATNEDSIEVGGLNLRLPLLDGWESLEDRQQRYLAEYAKDPDNKTLAAMTLGYRMSEVDKWFSQEQFSLVSGQIYNVYTEMLKSIDTKDAIGNSKIRARVIKAREAGGKYTEEKKGSQHLHINTGESLADFLKLLND
ncbi:MAG TPA: hypothetical protein VLA13_05090 [Massilibacterium sp.]|nr:hypothetical protein [Massilibacterium sp.]